MSHTSKRRYCLRNKPIEIKIQLVKNRIKSLEYDIKKKQDQIDELKNYMEVYLNYPNRS